MEVKGLVVVEDRASRDNSVRLGRAEALEDVANKPIAHHVVDGLVQSGVDEVIIASSHRMSHEIRASFANRDRGSIPVRHVEQTAPLNVASTLTLAAPLIGSAACIVHVASGFQAEPLAAHMRRLRTDAPDMAVIVQDDSADPIVVPADGPAEGLRLVKPTSPSLVLSAAGACMFAPNALQYASAAVCRSGSDIDLDLLAQEISLVGGRFHLLPASGWRRYAGDPLDLLELNRVALDQIEADAQPRIHPDNHIEGRVRVDENASVRRSVIVGPAVIGPGARVSDAYIGPYTSIGAGVHIEGAEIERSIVCPGATIMHVSARLTASVVGRHARIFRDFSLPRALHFRIGDGTEVALC